MGSSLDIFSSLGTSVLQAARAKLVLRSGRVARPVGAVGIDVERPRGAFDDLFRDHDLLYAFEARQVEHGVEQDAFHDRAQSACARLAVDRLAGDGAQRLLRKGEIDRLHFEQPLVLLHQRVLRLRENELERRLIEVLERGNNRQSADELGDEAIFQEILRFDVAENFAGLAILRRQDLGAEADRGRAPARRNDLLEPGEGAAAHKQDVRGVNLQELLLRMLASPLRRYRTDGAFHDLEQRLLHALAGDVAGDRRVVGLSPDLVDLCDIDDTALGAFDIVVGRLQQLEDDVLDVLSHIAGFGERRRIGHREGHIEDARERLLQQCLPGAGRTDQQDVRFRELDVVLLGLVIETLVVIVNRDREHLLGVILTDHVVVENLAYLFRGRDAVARRHQRGLVLLADDVHAQFDALVADKHGRTSDELAHLVLTLAAERAVERILGFAAARLAHLRTPTRVITAVTPQAKLGTHTIEKVSHVAARKMAAPPPHQLSRKLLRILDRLGCFSFLSAFASIWRMRSRVTANRWPTSSSVWSLLMPIPKRMRSTRSSRGVTDASTRVVVSRKLD